MSRIFNVTGTDGQYTNALDTVSGTAIGLAMPGVTINSVQSVYTAGLGCWRIISSQTNQIFRQGFMSKGDHVDPTECSIQPLTLQSDMLFQVYTDIADATANQSTCLALVTTTGGREAFMGTNIVDATSTAITSLISGLGIGDLFFGKTVTNLQFSLEDGGTFHNAQVIDAAGGTQYTVYGQQRLPTAGGNSNLVNCVANTSFPVQKGWSLKVKVTTA
jgi:hypothetical protein